MVKIVSVKFAGGNKPYYFAPGKDEYEKGMGVIVETAKGLEYATVVAPVEEVDESAVVAPLKPVVRIATERDREQVKRNLERRDEAMKIAREKIAARGLEMKPTGCEFSFDGGKVTFYFTAETRVDFRELIKDLSSAFHMRIELRQIGIRDEIKMMGGIAPCGRECCCAGCMAEPKKVSVKMAKNQGLSLNPSKISGLCGRLMCCLAYENDYYCEACKQVPKIGSEVETPDGVGIAVNVNMLKMIVKVKIEKNDVATFKDFGIDEIRFVRGNVVMGGLDDTEKAEENGEDGEELVDRSDEKPADSAERSAKKPFEKGERRDKRGRGNAPKKDGEKREGAKKDWQKKDGQRKKGDGNNDRPQGDRKAKSAGVRDDANAVQGDNAGEAERRNREKKRNKRRPNRGGGANNRGGQGANNPDGNGQKA